MINRIYLVRPQGEIFGVLNGIDENTATLKKNILDTWELSFEVQRYINVNEELVESDYYSSINEFMELLFVSDEEKIRFQIDSEPSISGDGVTEKKTVVAHSIEIELNSKTLKQFKVNSGTNDSQEYLVGYYDDDGNFINMNLNPYTNLPIDYIVVHNNYASQLSDIKEQLQTYDLDVSTQDGLVQTTNEDARNLLKTIYNKYPRLSEDCYYNPETHEYNCKVYLNINDADEIYVVSTNGNYTESVLYDGIDNLISFYETYGHQLSLIDLMLEKVNASGWSCGEIPDNIANKKYNFEIESQDILSFLRQQCVGVMKVIFDFDRYNRQIIVKDVENTDEQHDTGVFITLKNLMKSFEIKSSSEDGIKTKFIPTGADNLGILYVNFGEDSIINLDWFMNKVNEYGDYQYIPKGLRSKYFEWKAFRESTPVTYELPSGNVAYDSRRDAYRELSKLYNQYMIDIDAKKNLLPNDGCSTDFTTFTFKELNIAWKAYKNALETLETLYMSEVGVVSFDENTLKAYDAQGILILEDDPRYIKNTYFWLDFTCYKDTIIPNVENALKMYVLTDSEGNLDRTQMDSEGNWIEYTVDGVAVGNPWYNGDSTRVTENVSDAFLYDMSLYGTVELEAKRKAWVECASTLFKKGFLYVEDGTKTATKTETTTETSTVQFCNDSWMESYQVGEIHTQEVPAINSGHEVLLQEYITSELNINYNFVVSSPCTLYLSCVYFDNASYIQDDASEATSYGVSTTLDTYTFTSDDVGNAITRTFTIDLQRLIKQYATSTFTGVDSLYFRLAIGNATENMVAQINNLIITTEKTTTTTQEVEYTYPVYKFFDSIPTDENYEYNTINDAGWKRIIDSEVDTFNSQSSYAKAYNLWLDYMSPWERENSLTNTVSKGVIYLAAEEKAVKQKEIDELIAEQEEIYNIRANLADEVALEKWDFTDKEFSVLNTLIHEAEYNNNNILITNLNDIATTVDVQEELYQDATIALSEKAQPQLSFSTEINNLFSIEEFANLQDDVDLYNFIRVSTNLYKDSFTKLRIVSIEKNPLIPSDDLKLEFSNMLYSQNGVNDLTYLFSSFNGGSSTTSSGTSSGSGNNGGTYGTNDAEITIANNMLNALLKTKTFSQTVSNTVYQEVLNDQSFKNIFASSGIFDKLETGDLKINGSCITDYIKSTNYNGSEDTKIDNTDGSVLDLKTGYFNFGGGHLVWDGVNFTVKGSITVSDWNNVQEDLTNCPTYADFRATNGVQINASNLQSGIIRNVATDEYFTINLDTGAIVANDFTANNAVLTGSDTSIVAGVLNVNTLQSNEGNDSRIYLKYYTGDNLETLNSSIDITAQSISLRGNASIEFANADNTNIGTLSGSSFVLKNLYSTAVSGNNLCINADGVIGTVSSSKRFKHDISTNIENFNPEGLYDIPVVSYVYNDDYFTNPNDSNIGKTFVGFIAEDVADQIPNSVFYDDDGLVKMWDINTLFPLSIKLLQNQHIEIQNLKKTIEDLKNE